LGKTILIVEDDRKNMTLFHDFLQVKGFGTIEAVDGRQGVDYARLYKPDLILMDIMLPILNGIEAIKIIKSDPETSPIPIIALASFAMPNEKKLVFEAGGDGYMMKPVNIKTLLSKIKKYLPESVFL
jgi:CheY-like chemotaxis protein